MSLIVQREMARFYFHLFNDMDCRDEEGLELPNAAAALQRARVLAREMAAESVKQGHLILDHRIEVTNDRGDHIGTVHFRDVVEIKESAAGLKIVMKQTAD